MNLSKEEWKEWAVALSWANLLFLGEWINFLDPPKAWGQYESAQRYWATAVSLVVLIGLFAWAFWSASRWAERQKSLWLHILPHLAGLLWLLIPLNRLRQISNLSVMFPSLSISHWTDQIGGGGLVVLGLILLAGGVYLAYRKLDISLSLWKGVLMVTFPFFVWTLLRLAWMGIGGQIGNAPALNAENQVERPKGRVVWILFDELDYRLVFEKRPDGIDLPAFDKLRRESFFATQAFPPAQGTILSLPSLLLGEYVKAYYPTGPAHAELRYGSEPSLVSFEDLPNVFSKAYDTGARTAVVGWFHPYCRLFSKWMGRCHTGSRIGFSHKPQLLSNMVSMVGRLGTVRWERSRHIALHSETFEKAKAIVGNEQYDFVFLHLPIPHPPFIYDLKRKRISQWVRFHAKSYFGNVVLSDHVLGELRKEMEASGTWDRTTMIVSSDHRWRDSHSFDDKEDPRIPFFVKISGGTEGIEYHRPINTVKTDALVQAALRGTLSTYDRIPELLPSQQPGSIQF